MNKQANKVRFGLKNVHYAPILSVDDKTQKITYGDIKPFRGAVNLTIDPKGDKTEFYADDMAYFVENSNQGYEGTYEAAEVPEDFEIDILGREKDVETGVITESSEQKIKDCALMFEFDGDQHKTRHVLYRVSFARPSVGSSTKGNTTEPLTSELSFNASGRPQDGVSRRRTTKDTPDEVYNKWFDEVFEIAAKETGE